ncbi:MAG: group II intron reverse transcriptase/maturase [Proteobacteria bacterium]|nr:MAG: group II intron reverse transcriptase/maturase [Pseudomonadota bacterium]
MNAVIERENMQKATRKVISNGGAAGIDRMSTDQIQSYLVKEWPRIKRELVEERYKPQPALRVEIPKPNGGIRKLGIPTVLDRVIQQAILQVLSPIFEPTFSDSSYGFRPERSAHQAICKAQDFVREGYRYVVDVDLEQFFDRVNHDILMARIYRRVGDKTLLRLIRSYLKSGVMVGKILEPTDLGTPQGGPLSPLLSNILLTDLDRELESRNHKFVRYADDCNIYVKSQTAGDRVLETITTYLEKSLKLKVNSEKSAVDRPWNRKFLGYSISWHKLMPKRKVSKAALMSFKGKIRELFRKGKGCNVERFIKEDLYPYLKGWINFFGYAEERGIFATLDQWIRRKLRCLIWRQWKKPWTRFTNLKAAGHSDKRAVQGAFNERGPWWNSDASHMHWAFKNAYFMERGLVSLREEAGKLNSI